jgi:hypothetical protein
MKARNPGFFMTVAWVLRSMMVPVIMHVVLGINTYRDVSVASSIFGGLDEGLVPDDIVSAVIGRRLKDIIPNTENSHGPGNTTVGSAERSTDFPIDFCPIVSAGSKARGRE